MFGEIIVSFRLEVTLRSRLTMIALGIKKSPAFEVVVSLTAEK